MGSSPSTIVSKCVDGISFNHSRSKIWVWVLQVCNQDSKKESDEVKTTWHLDSCLDTFTTNLRKVSRYQSSIHSLHQRQTRLVSIRAKHLMAWILTRLYSKAESNWLVCLKITETQSWQHQWLEDFALYAVFPCTLRNNYLIENGRVQRVLSRYVDCAEIDADRMK